MCFYIQHLRVESKEMAIPGLSEIEDNKKTAITRGYVYLF
jgi:hypothetical protein